MSALIDSNPQYAVVKIIRVDWDEFGKSEIVDELSIPRRSTLVIFNKGEEVSRVVAQTSKAAIEALFQAVI